MPFAALWTGVEFIVWGDLYGEADTHDGAAYNPLTDRWRLLSLAPIALNEGAALWTGKEMILVGANLDRLGHDATARTAAIAYNPVRDRWRNLGFVDLSPNATWAVWTGQSNCGLGLQPGSPAMDSSAGLAAIGPDPA